ncbi:hypothetical protein [Salibacterium sp. K-3]
MLSSEWNQSLREILHYAIDHQQYDTAEQAVAHLRQLSAIEAFIHESSAPQQAPRSKEKKTGSVGAGEKTVQDEGSGSTAEEGITIHYIKEENVIKFRKSPQTYAVQTDFFDVFLEKLEEWRDKDPFSSKDFFDQFADSLKSYASYQTSTLRQFVTLLFRAAFQLGILEKPEPPQRSRYVTSSKVTREEVMEKIFNEKTIEL